MRVLEGGRKATLSPTHEAGSRDWNHGRKFIHSASASIMALGRIFGGTGDSRSVRGTTFGSAFWTKKTVADRTDICEIVRSESYRDVFLIDQAWRPHERLVARWFRAMMPIVEFQDSEWSKSFHVWRMDWDEKRPASGSPAAAPVTKLAKTINGDGGRRNFCKLDNGCEPWCAEVQSTFEVDYVQVDRQL